MAQKTMRPKVHPLQRPVHPVISGLIILGMVLLGITAIRGKYSTFFSDYYYEPSDVTPAPVVTLTSDLRPTTIPSPTPPSYFTYTSAALGISFKYPNYDATYNGSSQVMRTSYPKEAGNKISIVNKSVEVFYKEPQQTLENAIKQKILSGYLQHDCQIINANDKYNIPREDDSIVTAMIRPRYVPSQAYPDFHAIIAKCSKYVSANGVSYFMMDPKHPNKFLFIELGQDGLASGYKGYTWDGTIKVLR